MYGARLHISGVHSLLDAELEASIDIPRAGDNARLELHYDGEGRSARYAGAEIPLDEFPRFGHNGYTAYFVADHPHGPGYQPLIQTLTGVEDVPWGSRRYIIRHPGTGAWLEHNLDAPARSQNESTISSKTVRLNGVDFDGDGRPDDATWDPSDGSWRIRPSGPGAARVHRFGGPDDLPVPADYDHDGRADLATWRPAEQTFTAIPSGGAPAWTRPTGTPTDAVDTADIDALTTFAGALYGLAGELWNAGRYGEGMSARQERANVYDRLATADPTAYRPSLVSSLIDVTQWRQANLQTALTAGRRAVAIADELAGLTAPVSYGQLAGQATNAYWGGGYLAGAKYFLAYASWDSGDQTAARTSMQDRLRLYERLAAVEPANYGPDLASAQADLAGSPDDIAGSGRTAWTLFADAVVLVEHFAGG